MIALVTGANKGIGKEVVKQLLAENHTVILTSRNESRGKKAIQDLNTKDKLHYVKLDVSIPSEIKNCFDFVSQKFGRLDILINNAGINYDVWHAAQNADLIEAQETVNTNLFGAWRMCKAFIPLMKKNKYGRIVNVSSGAGAIEGMEAGTPAYSISKAAMNVLTIKLAAELKDSNVIVNSVCPGWVRTDMGGSNATRSVEEGAETIVWLANVPNGSTSGKFYRDKKVIPF